MYFKKMVVLMLAVQLFGSCFSTHESNAQPHVSFQVFYDELSPYGTWWQHDRYGYVWSPRLTVDFFPYASNGYWIFTHDGWTWVSGYDWGWGPFHYGRWMLDSYHGWIWVPGYEWAPAWVIWRSCNGYYGWTPWEPAVSWEVAFSPRYHYEQRYWRFVRKREMGRHDIENQFEGIGQYFQFLSRSEVIDNKRNEANNRFVYHAGPVKEEVEAQTGKKVIAADIVEKAQPGQSLKDNQLILFRPNLKQPDERQPAPQPRQVSPWQPIPDNQKPVIKETIIEKQIEKKDVPVQQAPRQQPASEKLNPPAVPEKTAIPKPKAVVPEKTAPTKAPVQIRQAPVPPPNKIQPVQKQAHPIDERPSKPLVPIRRPAEGVDSCME